MRERPVTIRLLDPPLHDEAGSDELRQPGSG